MNQRTNNNDMVFVCEQDFCNGKYNLEEMFSKSHMFSYGDEASTGRHLPRIDPIDMVNTGSKRWKAVARITDLH